MHISYCSRTDPGSDRPPQIVVHYLHDDGSIDKEVIITRSSFAATHSTELERALHHAIFGVGDLP